MENKYKFRKKRNEDNEWVKSVVSEQWGSVKIISKGKIYDTLTIPGFIAENDEKPIGLILYVKENQQCEIVALYSSIEKHGIGTKLIELVKDIVKNSNCKRIWLQTTNDNISALHFYQKRGFTIATIRPNAIAEQRRLKPIPLIGKDGIPIRDEIELEILI